MLAHPGGEGRGLRPSVDTEAVVMEHKSVAAAVIWLKENAGYPAASDAHIIKVCKGVLNTSYGFHKVGAVCDYS